MCSPLSRGDPVEQQEVSLETECEVTAPRYTCPSQAGENRQLPLKFSEPNGFHRIFHHESIWEGERGRGGRLNHPAAVLVWGGGPCQAH